VCAEDVCLEDSHLSAEGGDGSTPESEGLKADALPKSSGLPVFADEPLRLLNDLKEETSNETTN
jgi:hypothetical protein